MFLNSFIEIIGIASIEKSILHADKNININSINPVKIYLFLTGWSIVRARELSGSTKGASIHTLRHCLATHHLESGKDLAWRPDKFGVFTNADGT